MIDVLAALLREGFAIVLRSLLPMFAVAAVAAILVGLLLAALGLRDGVLGQIVRTLAVVLALGVLGSGIAEAVVGYAAHSWAGLGGR